MIVVSVHMNVLSILPQHQFICVFGSSTYEAQIKYLCCTNLVLPPVFQMEQPVPLVRQLENYQQPTDTTPVQVILHVFYSNCAWVMETVRRVNTITQHHTLVTDTKILKLLTNSQLLVLLISYLIYIFLVHSYLYIIIVFQEKNE